MLSRHPQIKESIRSRSNTESSNHCFAGRCCAINLGRDDGGTTMLTEKFDPYGEVLPDAGRGDRAAGKTGSAVLSRVGQYVFWLLVIIIVSARIAYYPA